MLDSHTLNGYWVPHHSDSGISQMALDEALLEMGQESDLKSPFLVVRTYQWNTRTLSLGVHQKDRDAQSAYLHYSAGEALPIVRRPTGGRAILHGEDVSFAFITNHPVLLRMTLDESYCFFTTWIRKALEQCDVPLQSSCSEDKRDYMRSPLCFETQTPSDLITPEGQKVAGSAQLRRQHGILQHGAAFIAPFDLPVHRLDKALCDVLTSDLGRQPTILEPKIEPRLNALWEKYRQRYASESEAILARLSMTSGSHLLPASD
jgi:lipoate---protein ligase